MLPDLSCPTCSQLGQWRWVFSLRPALGLVWAQPRLPDGPPVLGSRDVSLLPLWVCRSSDVAILVGVAFCWEQLFPIAKRGCISTHSPVYGRTRTRFAFNAAKGSHGDIFLSLQPIACSRTRVKKEILRRGTRPNCSKITSICKVYWGCHANPWLAWPFLARHERSRHPTRPRLNCVLIESEKPPRSLGCWMNKKGNLVTSSHSSPGFLPGMFSHSDSFLQAFSVSSSNKWLNS